MKKSKTKKISKPAAKKSALSKVLKVISKPIKKILAKAKEPKAEKKKTIEKPKVVAPVKPVAKDKLPAAKKVPTPKAPKEEEEEDEVRIPVKATHLTSQFLQQQKNRLLALRDALLDQMHDVTQATVREKPVESSGLGMHQGDAGSEAYDRDFALTILSQEQDALYEIEEALKRVDDKTYGVCEMTSKPIPVARLEAIPFCRHTVQCQAQLEKENRHKRRWTTETPFSEMMGKSEDDSDEDGDDDRRRE